MNFTDGLNIVNVFTVFKETKKIKTFKNDLVKVELIVENMSERMLKNCFRISKCIKEKEKFVFLPEKKENHFP